jgi:hypothetical protein
MTDRIAYALKHAQHSASTRDCLRLEGCCINGYWHGPPEAGKTKCTACLVAHRRSAKGRKA